ncbi:MAG: D-alanyl-D-alanine carboxypeptidase [Clostridia bacterium]|nr:D-alanyl-D-alanine carboxypeptidase [Clostridia bacterium]
MRNFFVSKPIVFLISFCIVFQLCTVSAAGVSVVKGEEEISLPKDFAASVSNDAELKKLPVEIKAKSAVLMEVSTGEILMEYNSDVKLFPASVTKIMTMLLVAEAVDSKKISLTDKVSCSENAASKGGSQIWLEPGESMSVDELLRATAIGSANDAATLLGEYVAGSEEAFISLMNDRAKEIGMKNTRFVNATGLDDTTDEHLTTARDIAIMSRQLLKHDFITKYTTVWMDSLRGGETELVNTNKLVRFYEGTTGLKTGTTAKAGCCVSASAKRDGLHLVAVVMGSANSNDRFNTAKAMLSWGFSNYTLFTPRVDNSALNPVKVIKGKTDMVTPEIPQLSPVLVKKGQEESVEVKTQLCADVQAPVIKGQTLGTVSVLVDGKSHNEYKITASDEVGELNLFGALLKIANFLSTGGTEYPFLP